MSFPPDPELNKFSVNNSSYPAIPFTVEFKTRDPTFTDVNYPVQKIWLNMTTNIFWFLRNFYLTTNNYYAANWIRMGGANIVESLRDQTSVDVFPDSTNEINLIGDGVYIETVGDPATNTITIKSISGNFFLGNTVDTFTGPGTNPAVPNSSGLITVTGGQVPAGTTTNVIQTDSLAANTYTVQIQRSQAVASTTIGDNGVSHFNSAQFTVDANGFVSIVGGLGFSSIKNQVFNDGAGTYTYTPTTGMIYCQITCLGGGGAGGGAPSTANNSLAAGGGGGAGEYAVGIFSAVAIGASKTVTLGAGGAGASGTTGGAGGTTSVGVLISSGGGGGGGAYGAASTSTGSATGGAGGTGGSGGDYRVPGYNGLASWSVASGVTSGFLHSGQGSDSQLGVGGQGVFVGNTGSGNGGDASGYGAGGAGAINSFSNSAVTGGEGSAGIVIIQEFIVA